MSMMRVRLMMSISNLFERLSIRLFEWEGEVYDSV